MTIVIIPPDQLRRAFEIIASAVQRHEALQSGQRAEIEQILASACYGVAAMGEYLGQLANSHVRPDNLRLAELSVESILQAGLGGLTDQQLVRLATTPDAIRELNTRVDEALRAEKLGQYWWKVRELPDEQLPNNYLGEDALHRVMAEIGITEDNPEADTRSTPSAAVSVKQRMWATYAGPVLALAACLLIGVTIGWFLRGGPQDRRETLIATAKVEPSMIRGPNDEKLQQVRVAGPFDGFVVIVALAPDRKQQVLPKFGQGDVPVSKGEQSEGVPVPADTTRALFFVTETPAGEPIRLYLQTKRFLANQETELQRELEDLLRSKGYRRIAIGGAAVSPAP
jgi:hypothetical protein